MSKCPAIEQKARAEDAEIQCSDETGLRSDDVRERSCAPIGENPASARSSNAAKGLADLQHHQSRQGAL